MWFSLNFAKNLKDRHEWDSYSGCVKELETFTKYLFWC